MKTTLALLVATTSILVFTQAADAQCGCQPTVSYYAPVPTTAYYAPPVTTYYAPTTTYYAPTTAYYGGGGYYGGGNYRGGAFGTGVFGWRGLRGIDRRYDRRNPVTIQPY
jgi:hypothetical protein